MCSVAIVLVELACFGFNVLVSFNCSGCSFMFSGSASMFSGSVSIVLGQFGGIGLGRAPPGIERRGGGGGIVHGWPRWGGETLCGELPWGALRSVLSSVCLERG